MTSTARTPNGADGKPAVRQTGTMTAEDWDAFAAGFSGLADRDIMSAAWR
ncbi:hypothetical protein [Cellulomonas palmilytica]|nr:hypothetical protein [Cellulomonas palmilytica]UJP40984.1 hypothetical protein F1D97_05830 [Cellulomonas palmilytica]